MKLLFIVTFLITICEIINAVKDPLPTKGTCIKTYPYEVYFIDRKFTYGILAKRTTVFQNKAFSVCYFFKPLQGNAVCIEYNFANNEYIFPNQKGDKEVIFEALDKMFHSSSIT